MTNVENIELRILIVDDESLDREQVRRQIDASSLNADCAEAAFGSEALTMAGSTKYDCVILDYRLPDVDGLDLVESFVQQRIPVVMLTGMGNETIAVEAMKKGAKDYLVKDSLSPENLDRAVVNAIEKLNLEIEVREKTEKLKELSLYDSLTGLPNRYLFFDRLRHVLRTARRSELSFAVFMMDLDLFKQVNDTYGHAAGDQLLKVVSKRLCDTVREVDTVSRLGGDEFAAVLTSIDSVEDATMLAIRIHKEINAPVFYKDQTYEVGISIGIAIYPDHAVDEDSLLHQADLAMYRAKNAYATYAVSGERGERSGLFATYLPKSLEEGLARDEFVVYYQPQLCLESGELSGSEALVRWNRPDVGLILPSEFIPGAERTALIRQLTLTVLEKSISQAAQWLASNRQIPISVNISPKLLADSSLPDTILEVLTRYRLPHNLLTLEITESGIMGNAELAEKVLNRLSDENIRIAIDDFGTGYTSMRYLRELPISELKIDKLFVEDLDIGGRDWSIIRSIIELADRLDISVVAEGIESQAVWKELAGFGCGHGQGFVISKPLPAEEMAHFYDTRESELLSQQNRA